MGRDSQSKGKLAELKVIGELVANGFSAIYTPIIDVEGIDIVVRRDDGSYAELQVKSRSRSDQAYSVRTLCPSANRFLVLHVLDTANYWVIPSEDFISLARKCPNGWMLSHSKERDREMARFRNWWDCIGHRQEVAGGPAAPFSTRAKRPRIGGGHLREKDYYPFIIELLQKASAPLTRKQIVEGVKEKVGPNLVAADRQQIPSGRPRWEATVRWAVSNLARQGKIKKAGRNQWSLTAG